MNKLLRSILPPLISLVIAMLGNGFFNTFVSLRMSADGHSPWMIGLLNSSYYAGLMLGSIYVQKLIARIGHIRTFSMFASLNSFVAVVQALSINPHTWVILRFFSGLCTAGFFIVIESWLLLSTGLKNRGKLLSLYMLTLYMAQGFGQFFLNFAAIVSLIPFAISILSSSLSVLPVCMMRSSGPMILELTATNSIQILRKVPLGPLGCFIGGMITSSFYSLAPIFGKQVSLSVFQISQMMGLTILGGLTLQWPIGHLSDLFNRKTVLLCVVGALLCITLVLSQSIHFHYYLFLCLMVLFGGISFTIYPLSITLTCDHFSTKNFIGITCTLLIIYGLGSISGPLLIPLFMSWLGASGFFYFLVLLCICLMMLGFLPSVKKGGAVDEEHTDYLPLPAAALAHYLDPRGDIEDSDFDEEDNLYPLSEEYEEEDD